MTNGLQKLPRQVYLPPVQGTPAIAPFAERWFLTPPPREYYYVREGSTYVLRKFAGTVPPPSNSYTITVESGLAPFFPGGSTVYYNYAVDTSSAVTLRVPHLVPESGPFRPPTTPEGYVLVSWTIFPKQSGGESTPGFWPVPPPAFPIYFRSVQVESNGFPRTSGRTYGEFDMPTVAGGYTRVGRWYEPTGPFGLFVPVAPEDPPTVTTQPTGTRAVVMRDFPGSPGAPYQPGRFAYEHSQEWDAGANSITQLDGDVYTRYTIPFAVGAYVGFFNDIDELGELYRPPDQYRYLRYGFFTYAAIDGFRYSLVDNGRVITLADNSYRGDTTFEVRRVAGDVSYIVGGARVYTSRVPLFGELRVGASLYATGDTVL